MSSRSTRGIGVLGAFALVAACSKGGNNNGAGSSASGAMASGAGATGAAGATASGATSGAGASTGAGPGASSAPLTDANIFALMDEANMSDSASGNMAVSKGTNADVKAFGREMMRDHHRLRTEGAALAKKLNVTPAPPTGDSLPAMAQRMSDSLNAAPKGAAWDNMYISGQVTMHQYVQNLLQTAQGAAQDTSLKAAIAKAIPTVQSHLTRAQSIQSKLGGSTSATGAGGAGGASGSGSASGAGSATGVSGAAATDTMSTGAKKGSTATKKRP